VRRFRARLAQLTGERDAKERLLEEMRKLEKFRREFVSNITHEIRTPLTGIMGAVEVLSEDDSLAPEDRTAMFNVLKEQTVRLDKLAQDILSLARIEHSEERGRRDFVVCDLSDVMKNVFTLMRPKAAAQGVGLVLLRNDRIRIACDAARIEESVQNLVENALRYSGSLTIELSLSAEGGRAKISVADRGVGIAPEHQLRIFERFYRVDKARSREMGGTGLGLAIVKHIAQLHGGEVSVASELGNGSVFTILL
jgi:two-component system phosphate regulon sensor histidine kinase PhoR